MELILRDGDYVPDGLGGFARGLSTQGMLAKALFLLSAKRGKSPILPDFGSYLYLLGREQPSAWNMVALQYANEALSGSGMEAVSATVTALDDDTISVAVYLQIDDDVQLLEVTV